MAIHLKAARINAQMTQVEVCKALNICKNTLSGYERYLRLPDIETAKKLSKLYGLSVNDIIWAAE